MSHPSNTTIEALQNTRTIAQSASILPGPAGIVAGVISEAIGLAIAAAQAGQDPLEHMKRLRREEELLAGARKHILEELKRKLGASKRDG